MLTKYIALIFMGIYTKNNKFKNYNYFAFVKNFDPLRQAQAA